MSDPVYKMLELTGTSSTGVEDAINNAVGRSAETVRQIGWFEVIEIRGRVEDGSVAQWQVTVKVGFKLEG
jgi:flavin-binding protein dodecin